MATDLSTDDVRQASACGSFGDKLKFVGHLFRTGLVRGTSGGRSRTLLLTLFIFFNACGSTSTGSAPPLSAGTLLREYQQSSTNARQKYDGKEISVRGLALSAATLPLDGADQGSVWLQESGRDPSAKVGCWFSSQQAADFSKIVSGQHVTIRGVFNGEAGVDLKFCRLVKVE